MITFPSLIANLPQIKSLSVIGIYKNVGKTTTLNNIISLLRKTITLGLTSIGIDGEQEDSLQGHYKPQIYVEQGTIIATGKQCINKSDFTPEILEMTGIQTPLGEIVIVKALSDGYVLLAGPSHTSEIKQISQRLKDNGSDLVLVDGAFSRRTLASPTVTNGTILAVGAAFSENMYKTVKETVFLTEIFALSPISDPNIIKLFNTINKAGYIDSNYTAHSFSINTAIDSWQPFVSTAQQCEVLFFVFKGAVSEKLLSNLIKNIPNLAKITIIVQDATKLLITAKTYDLFKRIEGKLVVINPIDLLCITVNPWSPMGTGYPPHEFITALTKSIKVPVFDLIGEDY